MLANRIITLPCPTILYEKLGGFKTKFAIKLNRIPQRSITYSSRVRKFGKVYFFEMFHAELVIFVFLSTIVFKVISIA